MMYPESILCRQQLTASSSRSSAAGDSPDSNSFSEPVMDHNKSGESSSSLKICDNKKLRKLLLKVNIQRSFGAVHVILSPENTVGDLIKAAIEVYVKEMRRPFLVDTDARFFDLHYSQFSLERLKTEEKLMNLESRNFFLCPKPNNINSSSNGSTASSLYCSNNEANTETMTVADLDMHSDADYLSFPCTRFMDFLL